MSLDYRRFQESITRELDIVKGRVRNLIGNVHWGEEGAFKEAVLRNVIKRFLPKNLSVGTGFIVENDTGIINDTSVSTQLDIIIYDNSLPILFSEGDFIITTQQSVKAVIEVKTRVTNTNGQNNSLMTIIEKFNNLSYLDKISETGPNRIFKGIFSYEYDDDADTPRMDEILRASNGRVNHISLGKNIFIRHWTDAGNLQPPVNCQNSFYNTYELNNLSFSYFISNLLHIVTDTEMDDRYWFSFPIQGTKEIHRMRNVCL